MATCGAYDAVMEPMNATSTMMANSTMGTSMPSGTMMPSASSSIEPSTGGQSMLMPAVSAVLGGLALVVAFL